MSLWCCISWCWACIACQYYWLPYEPNAEWIFQCMPSNEVYGWRWNHL